MTIKLLVLVILFSSQVFAGTKDLVIGCTYKCDSFFKIAMKRISRSKNISIRLVDLSVQKELKLSELDGVIVPGGADIDPKYYASAVEPDLQAHIKSLDHLVKYSFQGKKRDPFEFEFLKKYFASAGAIDLPLLGICRGMQMLAVSQGIPLYIDIKTELDIRNRRYLFDRIHIENVNSLLNELFKVSSFKAFKRHHQGIRIPYFNEHKARWPEVEITSYSNNGLIAESLEFKNRPVLGVQFHPENDFGFERRIIFSWLIEKALERKKLKDQISL